MFSFRKGTDQFCRLPLPTLFRNQRLHTLGTWCGYRYGLTIQTHFLDFYEASKNNRWHSRCRCVFSCCKTLSRTESISRHHFAVKKKRYLFLCKSLPLPEKLTLPFNTNDHIQEYEPDSFSVWIIQDIIIRTRLHLKTDSPMSNCCSHGILSHFDSQEFHLIACYYHQDLHPTSLLHGLC